MPCSKERESIIRSRKHENDLNWAVGRVSAAYGIQIAAPLMGVSQPKAKYWRKKVLNPGWRAGAHGGVRRQFDPQQEAIVCSHLRELVQTYPTSIVSTLCARILSDTGYRVSPTYVKTVLAAADWTYDIICHQFGKESRNKSFQ